jgi:hypothetical protein
VDIINKHDYEITVQLKDIKDNINYTLKHNLANKVIIVVDDIDIERFRTGVARNRKDTVMLRSSDQYRIFT